MKTAVVAAFFTLAVAAPIGAGATDVSIRIDTPEFGIRVGHPGYLPAPVVVAPPVYAPPPPPVYSPPVYSPPVYLPRVHVPPVYVPPVYAPPVYVPQRVIVPVVRPYAYAPVVKYRKFKHHRHAHGPYWPAYIDRRH